MRRAMVDAFTELAQENPDFVLITGDLGFGVFEDFAKCYPNQYINAGIAEQNMLGMASGLALEGKCVFVYSIGNFPTFRCLEQIRNDACYHKLNVNIVCQGGGFSYGALGMSHHATEDIGIMRVLPNTVIVAPYTDHQTKKAVVELSKTEGVGYLRIEKITQKNKDEGELIIGKGNPLRKGHDAVIFSYGNVLNEAVEASDRLKDHGIACSVVNMHTLKPIDVDLIKEYASHIEHIITLEEHNIIGGLGSAVSEILAEMTSTTRLTRLGLNDCYTSVVGDQIFLRKENSIDSLSIVEKIKELRVGYK